MKQINLRQNFYSSVIRSVLTLLALILLLVLVPQVVMLRNQQLTINNTTLTGVEIAKVLISLVMVGILLHFAYISETQLPKISNKFRHWGLIIASAVHIIIIFVAYFYLLPFATDPFTGINQVFNAIFILLLCIPLFRGGRALYQEINRVAVGWPSALSTQTIKCSNCGTENDPSVKFCTECGNKLIPLSSIKICPNCNSENEISAKFCSVCGNEFLPSSTKRQVITCPHCNTENKLGAKHCTGCGSILIKST